jgi:hypothetical protein
MWCHYCDKKNNHNTADCRAIAKFKKQKIVRLALKPNLAISLAILFVFDEINALKEQFKPESMARSKRCTKKGWIHILC